MNIMIKLININKQGNIIEADVQIVQTHPEEFKIRVDLREQKIISCSRKNDMYVIQALAKLIKLSEESGNKIPKQAESVWY